MHNKKNEENSKTNTFRESTFRSILRRSKYFRENLSEINKSSIILNIYLLQSIISYS